MTRRPSVSTTLTEEQVAALRLAVTWFLSSRMWDDSDEAEVLRGARSLVYGCDVIRVTRYRVGG